MTHDVTMARLAVCAICLVAIEASPARAEGGLIWSPAKVGRNAYDLNMGVKLPTSWEIRGGAKVNIAASQAGGRLNKPVRPFNLWGTVATPPLPGGAIDRTRGEVNFDFNTMSGRTFVQMKSTRTRMLTPGVDIEATPSLSTSANAYRSQEHALNASLATRLSLRDTGTAFVARGTVASGQTQAHRSFAIEQSLTRHLHVNAAVTETGDGVRRSLRARYSISW